MEWQSVQTANVGAVFPGIGFQHTVAHHIVEFVGFALLECGIDQLNEKAAHDQLAGKSVGRGRWGCYLK